MCIDCSKDGTTRACGNGQIFLKLTLVMGSGVIFDPATLKCAIFFYQAYNSQRQPLRDDLGGGSGGNGEKKFRDPFPGKENFEGHSPRKKQFRRTCGGGAEFYTEKVPGKKFPSKTSPGPPIINGRPLGSLLTSKPFSVSPECELSNHPLPRLKCALLQVSCTNYLKKLYAYTGI